jgi:hypothetical protein
MPLVETWPAVVDDSNKADDDDDDNTPKKHRKRKRVSSETSASVESVVCATIDAVVALASARERCAALGALIAASLSPHVAYLDALIRSNVVQQLIAFQSSSVCVDQCKVCAIDCGFVVVVVVDVCLPMFCSFVFGWDCRPVCRRIVIACRQHN